MEASNNSPDNICYEIQPRRKLQFEDADSSGRVEVVEPLNIIEDDVEDVGVTEDDDAEKVPIPEIGKEYAEKVPIPEIGKEFDNEPEAYEFYNNYAMSMGFGIRRNLLHKGKKTGVILDREFCCLREGKRPKDKRDALVKSHRPETRCGCLAKMKISRRGNGKKFRVVTFVVGHNHELTTPSKTIMFRSHRNITSAQESQINSVKSCGVAPKQILDIMVKQAGGRENLGFNRADLKNYLRSKRSVEMKQGDTGGVLEYLQKMQLEDPNFFYAIQVDEDDLITNIFWADAKMRYDFARFGDVVSFDTTYRKHKDGRPIALFVGVNHHKQTAIFGAALLYDETVKTFEWLFETFSTAMMGKEPKTILTDQDGRMASALASQWTDTCHRLCIWHIYQNAAIHLSDVFSNFKDFSTDFTKCIYDYEEEEDFILEWKQMLERYNLSENKWLQKMFEIRRKWALVYGRETFCADMTTTQRSETMNSVLKRYVNYKNELHEFFEHFQRLLKDRRNEESDADFRCSQSTPAMTFPVAILKHAADVYTFEVYEKFKVELCKGIDCSIESQREEETRVIYNITQYRRHQHVVTYDSSNNNVCCSCKKFEFAGILCAHALKVFTTLSIRRIPDDYILKRWTKGAKSGIITNSPKNGGIVDEKEKMALRYKELSHMFMQLVTKAAECDEYYEIAKEGFCKMSMSMDVVGRGKKAGEAVAEKVSINVEVELDEGRVVGLDERREAELDKQNIKGVKVKERITYRSSKRPLNALERAIKKPKRKPSVKVQCKTNKGTTEIKLPEQPTQATQGETINGVCTNILDSSQNIAWNQDRGSTTLLDSLSQNVPWIPMSRPFHVGNYVRNTVGERTVFDHGSRDGFFGQGRTDGISNILPHHSIQNQEFQNQESHVASEIAGIGQHSNINIPQVKLLDWDILGRRNINK